MNKTMTREEAIRRIKEWNLDADDMEVLSEVIPELKESEDEKIRKGLIRHLEELRDWKVDTMVPIKVSSHYDAWITWLEKQKEQKPSEWSEDDSIKSGILSEIIFDYAFHKDALDENQDLTDEYAELDNWLESLPERFSLQPKNEWSEEDESMLNLIVTDVSLGQRNCGIGTDEWNVRSKAVRWIKSLPERFNLEPKEQKPLEWNEDDRDRVAQYLHDRDGGMLWSKATEITSDILDILRPQPRKEI